MGPDEVAAFLSHLAAREHVSASIQNQALCALLFLYSDVLQKPLAPLPGIVHARRPVRVPVVLTRSEVRAVLAELRGTPWLLVSLYGSGLRLMECLQLRVKDLDLDRHQMVIRRAKGQKDRVTVLPDSVRPRLLEHLESVRRIHASDLMRGFGTTPLPEALERKYLHAGNEWKWQFVFPDAHSSTLLTRRVPNVRVTTAGRCAAWFRRWGSSRRALRHAWRLENGWRD
jgi:integrase